MMKKKGTYFFVGFLLLAVGLLAYHFYAANRAEQTIEKSIQEITAQSESGVTVDYSSVDVDPFTGNIRLTDINIINDREIQRATTALFDLSYGDFLNFTIWGAEAGLKEIDSGVLILNNISYTNRQTLSEVKVDSLNIDYQGNVWNLIVLAATPSPAQIRHDLRASGRGFRYYQSEGGIGSINADSLQLTTHFGKETTSNPDSLFSSISLSGITWGPPASIQEKYQFFIRGFDYQTDAIPLQQATASYYYLSDHDLLRLREAVINSELFTITVQGNILLLGSGYSNSEFHGISVTIHEMSSRFQKFLQQAQQLFDFKLPGDGQQIQLHLNGPVSNLRVTFGS